MALEITKISDDEIWSNALTMQTILPDLGVPIIWKRTEYMFYGQAKDSKTTFTAQMLIFDSLQVTNNGANATTKCTVWHK